MVDEVAFRNYDQRQYYYTCILCVCVCELAEIQKFILYIFNARQCSSYGYPSNVNHTDLLPI